MHVLCLTSDQLRTAQSAINEMKSSFAGPLSLWTWQDGWHLVNVTNGQHDGDSGVSFDRAVTDPETLPRFPGGSPGPFCHTPPGRPSIIGVPIETSCSVPVFAVGEPVFAVGQEASGIDFLLGTIARQTTRIVQLQQSVSQDNTDTDRLSDQILRDFEERDWLIRMGDLLQICEVSRDLSDVAASMVPDLMSIIRASAVAFLPETSLPGSRASDRGIVCCSGNFAMTEPKARRIVTALHSRAWPRLLVLNLAHAAAESDELAGITTLMLAPVARNSYLVGWLLAVNRPPDAPNELTPPVDPLDPEFRDDGFGTSEAGLLRSAASVLATHYHNLSMFRANQNLTVGVVQSLANTVDARDAYTRGHSGRVARMAQQLASCLNADPQFCSQIYMTGLLHDIGKIGVPDAVLLKRGRLNSEETHLINQHPRIGYRILKPISELAYTLDGVLHHHEAWNGRGYPDGRSGTDIPLSARILAVVDAFDAMTSHRPYRIAMPFDDADSILRNGAGSHWDPEIVDAFLQNKQYFRRICCETTGLTDPTSSVEHCLLTAPYASVTE